MCFIAQTRPIPGQAGKRNAIFSVQTPARSASEVSSSRREDSKIAQGATLGLRPTEFSASRGAAANFRRKGGTTRPQAPQQQPGCPNFAGALFASAKGGNLHTPSAPIATLNALQYPLNFRAHPRVRLGGFLSRHLGAHHIRIAPTSATPTWRTLVSGHNFTPALMSLSKGAEKHPTKTNRH